MNITGRWPALVLIPAVIAAMVAIDDGYDRPSPAALDTPLAAQGLGPVAADEAAISSTWFCAGGTAEENGNADHVVRVVNVGPDPLRGTVTAIPSQPETITAPAPDPVESAAASTTTVPPTTQPPTTQAPTTTAPARPDEVVVPIDVPSGESVEVRLADHIESSFAAGLVELDGGVAAVEHDVSGPDGADTAPCASQTSPTWYFAAGQTTVDAKEVLTFFNPFPDPAVVDVTFRTDEDLRSPEEFQGLIIPARSVLAREIGSFVTRRAHVSTSVVARSGQLVVDRIMVLDGSVDNQGLDVALGAATPAEVWYSPDGIVSESISERFVVYNPGETRAEVDLTLEPIDESIEAIEPFQLTIPPQGFQELVVSDEARIGTAIDNAGADFLRHGTRIVSLNGVPVVVERTLVGEANTARTGYDISAATPLLTDRAVIAGAAADRPGIVSVQNRDGATMAVIRLVTPSGDEVYSIEVPPATTADIDLSEITGGDDVLMLESSLPVAVERRRRLADGVEIAHTIAPPLAGAIVLPAPPG
jgi:hypothetical protein